MKYSNRSDFHRRYNPRVPTRYVVILSLILILSTLANL